MGNGNKAQQKRERAAAKGPKEAKSQLKSNASAQTYNCKICRQSFQSTTNKKELEVHADARHSKTYSDCFEA